MTIVRLMGDYLVRVVVGKGVLKSRAARLGVLVCVILFLITTTALATFLTHGFGGDESVLDLVVTVNSLSSVLWTAVAFLIVKVLMADAGTMMAITHNFPVTNRERQRAVSVLDAATTLLLVVIGMFATSTSTLVNFGVSVLPGFMTCVVMPAMATYTVLEYAQRCCDLALAHTPLRHARQPLLAVVVFFVVLALWRATPSLLSAITSSPQPFAVWTLLFHDIHLRCGTAATIGSFAFLLILSLLPITVLPTSPLEVRRRFVKLSVVDLSHRFNRLAPQFRALFRSRYSVQAAILSLGFVVLLATRVAGPSSVWGVEPMTIGGFFQYATLAPTFRALEPRLSASRFYLRLIVALGFFMFPMLVVAVVIDVIAGQPLVSTVIAAAGVCGSALVTTGVGIFVPARDDNPLSILLGGAIVLIIATVLIVFCGILRLPNAITIVLGILTAILLIIHSILTIADHRKAAR
ncbi:ABC transporter permease [Cutibacterium sp.]|uniref:ABC transporter permease n=1 Tax=Cutibacterium sp. TaxID=1912221 RepID=UPI0034C64F3A